MNVSHIFRSIYTCTRHNALKVKAETDFFFFRIFRFEIKVVNHETKKEMSDRKIAVRNILQLHFMFV